MEEADIRNDELVSVRIKFLFVNCFGVYMFHENFCLQKKSDIQYVTLIYINVRK